VAIIGTVPTLASSYPISIRSVTLNSRRSSLFAPRRDTASSGTTYRSPPALHTYPADSVVRPVDVRDLFAVGQRRDRDDVAGDERDPMLDDRVHRPGGTLGLRLGSAVLEDETGREKGTGCGRGYEREAPAVRA